MKLRSACRIVSVVTLGVPLLIGTARAGDSYSQSIVPAPLVGSLDGAPVNSSDFRIKYPGGNKFTTKPSKVLGEGMVTMLVLKNVDCPLEGNDQGKPNKCGISGSPVPAVVDLSVHQFMTPSIGIDMLHVAGIPITFTKGMATFVASGTNKVIAPQVFADLITQTLTQPLGMGAVAIKTQGSVPTDCATAPAGVGCLDGIEFGFAGIIVGP